MATAPAATVTTTETKGNTGSGLTQKWHGVPLWAWTLGGTVAAVYLYKLYKGSKASNAASNASNATTAGGSSNLCTDSSGNIAPCTGGCTDANGQAVPCTSTNTYTADLITTQYNTLEQQLQALLNGQGSQTTTAPPPSNGASVVVVGQETTNTSNQPWNATLNGIAQCTGIPLATIIAANPGVNPLQLQQGQIIQVPGWNGQKNGNCNLPAQTGGNTTTGSGTSYTVKPGDYLYKIAQQFGVDPTVLYNANKTVIGPNQNNIQAGQVLTIPPAGS